MAPVVVLPLGNMAGAIGLPGQQALGVVLVGAALAQRIDHPGNQSLRVAVQFGVRPIGMGDLRQPALFVVPVTGHPPQLVGDAERFVPAWTPAQLQTVAIGMGDPGNLAAFVIIVLGADATGLNVTPHMAKIVQVKPAHSAQRIHQPGQFLGIIKFKPLDMAFLVGDLSAMWLVRKPPLFAGGQVTAMSIMKTTY